MTAIASGNRLGGGFVFDRVNDKIEVPYFSDLNIQDGTDFSVASALIPTSFNAVNGGTIWGCIDDGNANLFGLVISITGILTFHLFQDPSNRKSISTVEGLKSGALYYITVVKNGSNVTNWKLGINGKAVSVSTASVGTPVMTYGTNFTFGARRLNNSFNFGGYIHRLKTWNAVLSDSEILQDAISFGAAPVKSPNIIEDWDFNEKSGNTLIGKKGNNGVISGATTTLGASNQHVDKYQQPILV